MTGGGRERPTAPIFTPPATREGARKKETRRRLTKFGVCERHGNPPCPTCALTHRGLRHCCGRGRHHGHPKDACTPRHTSRNARLASQRTPGVGGTPALKRPMGRIPPGTQQARHGPAQPPAPSSRGGGGMKRQRETPPPRETRQAPMLGAPRAAARPRGHGGDINTHSREALASARAACGGEEPSLHPPTGAGAYLQAPLPLFLARGP